jgi:hypothetical protein
MKKIPPIDEKRKPNMGLFDKNTQTIAITQAAGGQSATAEVVTPVPLWEIIIICVTLIVVLEFLKKMC